MSRIQGVPRRNDRKAIRQMRRTMEDVTSVQSRTHLSNQSDIPTAKLRFKDLGEFTVSNTIIARPHNLGVIPTQVVIREIPRQGADQELNRVQQARAATDKVIYLQQRVVGGAQVKVTVQVIA